MDKKKIFIIGGVVLALGVGFYFWNKSKNTTGGAEGGADGSAETPADTTKSTEASAESSTQTDPSVKTATSIKDLKGKDKKDFKKETKDVCKEKYGKGNDYRKCKTRVKKGGVAFDGTYYESINDFTNFEGLNLDL